MFDFYVNQQYIIEFDGEQHYKPIDYFGGQEALIATQKRDQIKNSYCFNHNIPIIRIPYDKIEDISLETITPATSKYLLQKEN